MYVRFGQNLLFPNLNQTDSFIPLFAEENVNQEALAVINFNYDRLDMQTSQAKMRIKTIRLGID